MVDIHKESEVHALRRESRVLDGPADGFHIFDLPLGGAAADDVKHLVLDVDGQHPPASSHPLGEAKGKISRSGSDVRDGHSRQGSQGVQQSLGGLFNLPFRPVQPGGALVAHDTGDLPAHVELAGSVGIGAGPVLVTGRFRTGNAGKQQEEADKKWKRSRFHGTRVYQQTGRPEVEQRRELAVEGLFDSPATG